MSDKVISKQRYLVHSHVYSKADVVKYRLSIPADTPVTTEMFFGSKGYDSYVRNGHGNDEEVELLDDVTAEEAKAIKASARKGYAGDDYVGNEHGVASDLDVILSQIDRKEGNSTDDWKRSPFTISSIGRLDTPEKRQMMSDLMRAGFSKKGDIVWYPIVSIENYQVAKDMELFKDEDYEAVINESLPRWFKSVRLDPDNMIWTADYHNNTDNPHLHYIFLEKVRHRTKGNFSVSDLNNLKEQFYSAAMKRSRELRAIEKGIDAGKQERQQLKLLHQEMDSSNAQVRKNVDEFLSKKMDLKIDQEIYTLFAKIDEVTLGRGKISVNSKNMAPFRKDVEKIVDDVLEHPANRDLYEEAKENWKKLDEVTKGKAIEDADRYQVNEDRKLRTSIGNSILRLKKDYDEAYYRYHIENKDYDQMSRKELKLLRNKYLKSRDYEISLGDESQSGIRITFKDEALQKSFMSLIEKSEFDKVFTEKKLNDSSWTIDSKDEQKSDLLLSGYLRAAVNNLQDHPENISEITSDVQKIVYSNDEQERRTRMLNYIAANRNQPDSEFFFERKPKKFFTSYMNGLSNLSRSSQIDRSPSGSFMVLSGLQRLMSQRVHNTIAAQKVEKEAEQYWENQQYLDQRKKQQKEREQERDAEISY